MCLYYGSNVRCNGHVCNCCAVYQNIVRNKADKSEFTHELFDNTHVLKKTVKGGGLEYLYRPIVLKPEAMSAKGIKVCLYNQILISTDGGGMFSWNPGSEIDGYLASDYTRMIYTFGRQDFYGVPNEYAIERFYELFQIDLKKYERS